MRLSLTAADIIEQHDTIIRELGGDHGMISSSSLYFIVDHASANPYSEKFFTLLAKILWAITVDHPFTDGNKRTGLVIVQAILKENNYILELNHKEKEEFILSVASLQFELEDLIDLLESVSRRI